MERQDEVGYIKFLEYTARLRNSLAYEQAVRLGTNDLLGMAAVLELRRLSDGENH